MSHTESEIGVYTLPSDEFKRVREGVKAAWNAEMAKMFEAVLAVYQQYPGIVYHDAVRLVEESPKIADWQEDLVDCLLMQTGHGGFAKPTKKALKDVEFDAIVKSQPFYAQQGVDVVPMGDGGIFFKADENRIEWRVEPNNHAVDDAHLHPVGFAFLKLLDTVKWTPETGGRMTHYWEGDQRTYRVYGKAKAEALA